MKEEMIQNISIVLNALNNVSVSGKANLANLSGSIAMLEEVLKLLGDEKIEITECAVSDK